MTKQLREALEAARAWILAVEHRVEGHAVVEKIDEALAALSAPAEQAPALSNPSITVGRDGALLYWRSPAGYFSIILDDEGEYAWSGVLGDDPANSSAGFVLTEEVIDTFRDVLAASPSAPTAVQPADKCLTCNGHGMIGGWRAGEGYDSEPCPDCNSPDALTPTERAACQQCGSDPHKMSCSVGGKHQLRLTANEVAQPAAQAQEAGGVDAWKHLMPYGYAPGNYMSRCHACGDSFAMDKRAITCRRCAEQLAARAAQPATPVAPKTLEALTELEVLQVLLKADCFGKVKLTTESGAYDIDRLTVKGALLAEYFTRALATKNGTTLGDQQ